MATPLLKTKLYIPPTRPELVSRPRLIERLNAGLDRKLTLISAPAGFGKTTLLSEWVASCGQPAAWLSLDKEDDDPVRFWTYMVAALQTIHAGPLASLKQVLGQDVLQTLQLPQLPPVQSILPPLLNDIATFADRVVLILDDYHVISAQAVHDGIAFLLDHQPQQLHLVLATRTDPALPIVRLRARGQLTELRADDLRFTPDEAVAFLNELMGLGLLPEDVAALESRTEGWAVGLQLAAIALQSLASMQGRADVQEFISAFTGSHHYVLEYLTEEVTSRQPESVQRFLLQTSVLDRLCGPLCDAVTGEDDGGITLAHLYRSNLFVVPLDNEHYWYRYHHLFADLLYKNLRQGTSPAQVLDLHRRASQWYEQNGSLDKAVTHALKAEDLERVARLAEQAIQASALDSRLTKLLHWLQALPEEVLQAHPRLCIYRAWALFLDGQLDLAEKMLQDSKRALESLPPSPENDALRKELGRLLDTMEAIALGLTYGLDGDIEQSIQASLKARGLAEEAGNIFLAALATEGLALAYYHQGRLRQSAQSCQHVVDLAEQSSGSRQQALQLPPPPERGMAAMGYVELAGICREWNDLDAAARHLDKAITLCQQGGGIKTLIEAYVAKSRLWQTFGDVEGALELLHQAEQVYRIRAPYSVTNFRLAVQRARLNLSVGKLEEIARWVRDVNARFSPERAGRSLPASMRAVVQMTLARVHLARGKADKALKVLEPLYVPAETAGRFGQVIEICLLQALALQAQGNTAAALAQLERSLALAEPEGYARIYLDEGVPAARLLAAFCRAPSKPAHLQRYAQSLLAMFDDATKDKVQMTQASDSSSALRPSSLVEPLTKRELQVLRLMAADLSSPEIAEELVIAVSTARSHIKSIYGKLGAHSRYEAVERARALHLL